MPCLFYCLFTDTEIKATQLTLTSGHTKPITTKRIYTLNQSWQKQINTKLTKAKRLCSTQQTQNANSSRSKLCKAKDCQCANWIYLCNFRLLDPATIYKGSQRVKTTTITQNWWFTKHFGATLWRFSLKWIFNSLFIKTHTRIHTHTFIKHPCCTHSLKLMY